MYEGMHSIPSYIQFFLNTNNQINLVFRLLNRKFNFVEFTHARKNSNKFGFSLA